MNLVLMLLASVQVRILTILSRDLKTKIVIKPILYWNQSNKRAIWFCNIPF